MKNKTYILDMIVPIDFPDDLRREAINQGYYWLWKNGFLKNSLAFIGLDGTENAGKTVYSSYIFLIEKCELDKGLKKMRKEDNSILKDAYQLLSKTEYIPCKYMGVIEPSCKSSEKSSGAKEHKHTQIITLPEVAKMNIKTTCIYGGKILAAFHMLSILAARNESEKEMMIAGPKVVSTCGISDVFVDLVNPNKETINTLSEEEKKFLQTYRKLNLFGKYCIQVYLERLPKKWEE